MLCRIIGVTVCKAQINMVKINFYYLKNRKSATCRKKGPKGPPLAVYLKLFWNKLINEYFFRVETSTSAPSCIITVPPLPLI